ncbi:MAG: hypothetical protein M1587_10740, partial [Thaumarchaeota archaeon]|nr:hypothetical protein [Nitrososphaerota archaeon]
KPSGSLLIHDIEPKSVTSRFERRASGVHFSSSGELIQKLEAHGFHQVRKMDAKRGFMILAKKAEEA